MHLRSALGMLIGANVRNGPAIVLARLRQLMPQLVNSPLMSEWDSFSMLDYLREDF